MVEAAFLQYGTIVHVVSESPTWGPKTGDPLCEHYGMRYEFAYVTYSDKASAVAAQREMQGFIFIGAGVPTDDRRPTPAPGALPPPPGMARSIQEAGGRRQETQKRQRSDRMTMTVGIGYVEVEGKGELVGRGTERTHVVRLADVVAGG